MVSRDMVMHGTYYNKQYYQARSQAKARGRAPLPRRADQCAPIWKWIEKKIVLPVNSGRGILTKVSNDPKGV